MMTERCHQVISGCVCRQKTSNMQSAFQTEDVETSQGVTDVHYGNQDPGSAIDIS